MRAKVGQVLILNCIIESLERYLDKDLPYEIEKAAR